MSFYKTIVIAIFKQRLYHDIFFFPCQELIILGSFDKMVPNEKWDLDIANKDWALNIVSENWTLILPMRIGF